MKPLQDLSTLALALALFAAPVAAQVPQQINYQGRVTVGGVNFTGGGQFKFALVDGGVNLNQTATANATTTGGGVQIFLLTMGSGYTSAPAVTITNGAGSNGAGGHRRRGARRRAGQRHRTDGQRRHDHHHQCRQRLHKRHRDDRRAATEHREHDLLE